MSIGFVLANYRVYEKQEARIGKLNAAIADDAANPDRDVDALRALLARLWALNPNPIGRHIPAVAVGQELRWEEDRLNAAGFRAAGNFGNLRIAFDGRTFLLQQIPR